LQTEQQADMERGVRLCGVWMQEFADSHPETDYAFSAPGAKTQDQMSFQFEKIGALARKCGYWRNRAEWAERLVVEMKRAVTEGSSPTATT